MAERPELFMDLGARKRKKVYDRTMSLDNSSFSEEYDRVGSLESLRLSVDQLSPQHLWAHGQHMLQKSRSSCNRGQGQMKGRIVYKKFLVLSSIKRRSWPSLSPSKTW